MNTLYQQVLDRLPYKSSFRFVDDIAHLDAEGCTGHYTYKHDSFFYEDHFPGNPVTPGAIVTETMAQIGLVVLGIYLILPELNTNKETENNKPVFPLLTSAEVSFYKMVLPGEKVTVISKREYFRFGKLKCKVEMLDENKETIAIGVFAGIIQNMRGAK